MCSVQEERTKDYYRSLMNVKNIFVKIISIVLCLLLVFMVTPKRVFATGSLLQQINEAEKQKQETEKQKQEAEKEKELPATEEGSLPHLIRHIDNVKVKGKTHAVRIYALSTDDKEYSDSFLENYRKGLNQYEIGNFKTAEEYFMLANGETPGDKATQELLDRCKKLFEEKPKDWDGAIALTTK